MVERFTNTLSNGFRAGHYIVFMVKDLFLIVLALETLGHLIVNKCMGFMRTM